MIDRPRVLACLRHVCLCVATAVAVGACGLVPKEEAVLAPPLVTPAEVEFRAFPAQRGSLEHRVGGTGTFVPVEKVEHHYTFGGGRLWRMLAVFGRTVEAGDVLAELETSAILHELDRQRILVERAEVNLRARQAVDREYEIRAAQLDVELVRVRVENIRRDLTEARSVASALPGDPDLQQAVGALERSYASGVLELERAELALERLRSDESHRFQVESAELDLSLAVLELQSIERRLEQARLRARISGVVTYLDTGLRTGSLVNPYQTVVTVANPRALQLECWGVRMADFPLGTRVSVTFRRETYGGTVVATVADVPIEERERFRDRVLIALDVVPPDARIGDMASVSLVLERRDDVIVLPRGLIRTYLDRRYVYVLQDGVRTEVDVQVGMQTATEVEIVRGLDEGALVIYR